MLVILVACTAWYVKWGDVNDGFRGRAFFSVGECVTVTKERTSCDNDGAWYKVVAKGDCKGHDSSLEHKGDRWCLDRLNPIEVDIDPVDVDLTP